MNSVNFPMCGNISRVYGDMLNWLILPAIFTIGLSVPLCTGNIEDDYISGPENILAVGVEQADFLLGQSNISTDAKEKIMELIHRFPKLESEEDLKPILREGLQLWHGMCFNDKLAVMDALWHYDRLGGQYMDPVIRALFKENMYDLAYTGKGDIVAHLQFAFDLMQEKLDTLYREEPEAYRKLLTKWKVGLAEFVRQLEYNVSDRTWALDGLKQTQPLVLILECTMQEVDRSNDTLIATAYNECERLIGYGFHDFARF